MRAAAFLILLTVGILPARANKDNSASYQMGTFIAASAVNDGTITSNLHGDGTTIAGGVYANAIAVYTLQVSDGYWKLNTYTQNKDSMLRDMGMTPMHFKAEKGNPLDVLKGGERVLFRVEKHQKLNGVETSVFIPYADNPQKEFHFIGYFYPNTPKAQEAKPTDNVKAMCDAHKLSPELERQYCTDQPPVPAGPSDTMTQYNPADVQTAASLSNLSCPEIKTMILSNSQMATYLPYTWKTAQLRCKE